MHSDYPFMLPVLDYKRKAVQVTSHFQQDLVDDQNFPEITQKLPIHYTITLHHSLWRIEEKDSIQILFI